MDAHQNRHGGGVRRMARWAANLAILAVIVGCAAWIVPSAFGYSRYIITGGSMTGTYDKGSVVFEEQVPVADLKVGDVITYLPPADSGLTTLVTHRIVDMQPADGGGVLFTTKGDHNPSADPWHFVLLDSKQPVVRFGVPHAGWVFIALADRQVRMLAVGGPAALIALFALAELAGAIRSSRRRPGSTPASAAGAVQDAPPQPRTERAAGVGPAPAGHDLVEGAATADLVRIPPQRLPDSPTPASIA
jgi:signal peptidase I